MKSHTVVALGDSLTYGYPYTPEISWVQALGEAAGWQVINAGISGDTLLDMAARLEQDVLKHQPRLVIVMGGTNDIYQGLSRPQMEGAFLEIMQQLQEIGSERWLGLPLPVADSMERGLRVWRQWLRQYAQSEGLTLIDFYQDFINEQGQIREELLLDGCHPRLAGYKIMGQRIIAAIKDRTDINNFAPKSRGSAD